MQVKKSGAVVPRPIAIAVAIAVVLGTSLGIASANGDEGGVEETKPAITATAEATGSTVDEVPAPGDKGDETTPSPEPSEEPTLEPSEEPSVTPSPEPSDEPSEEPSPEPSEQPTPVAGDLLVQCTADGRISLTNNSTWLASVIAGYFDSSSVEVPLSSDVQVFSGDTDYIDISSAPSGVRIYYWTVWMDLEGGSDSIENGGTIVCGEPEPSETPAPSPEPSEEPSVTPSPEPSEEPSVSPSPDPSEEPTPTDSATPTPTESVKPSPKPTPSAEPSKSAPPIDMPDSGYGGDSAQQGTGGLAIALGLVMSVAAVVFVRTRKVGEKN